MIADLNAGSLICEHAAFRRVRFSTSVTATFTLNPKLTPELLDATADFWRQRGVILSQKLKAPKGDGEPLRIGLRGEGGSLWSISFEKYKKKVAVSFRFDEFLTHVTVRVELPGAYAVSSSDVRKANEILEAFEKRLVGIPRQNAMQELWK